MIDYSYRLDLDDIDRGGGDCLSQHLLSLWRRSEGELTDDYIASFPKLVMLDGAPNPAGTPDLLVCGHDALSVKILGQGWADSAAKAKELMGPNYCTLVGRSYFEATTRHVPVYDVIHAEMCDTSRRTITVFYSRLILPIRTAGGSRFLLGYSFAPQTARQALDFSGAAEIPPGRSAETPDYANLFSPAGLSTRMPMHRSR